MAYVAQRRAATRALCSRPYCVHARRWCGPAGRSRRTPGGGGRPSRRPASRCRPGRPPSSVLERGQVGRDLLVHLGHVAARPGRAGRPPCRRSTGRARRPARRRPGDVAGASAPPRRARRPAARRRRGSPRPVRGCAPAPGARRAGVTRLGGHDRWPSVMAASVDYEPKHDTCSCSAPGPSPRSRHDRQLPLDRRRDACSAVPRPRRGPRLGARRLAAAADAEAPALQGSLPREVDVVVVGAGIAGLVAARKVAASGLSVLARRGPRPGRRPRAQPPLKPSGATIEAGGAFIGPTQNHIAALAKELKVPTFKEYNTGNSVYVSSTTGRMEYSGTVPPDPTILPDAALLLQHDRQYAAEIAVDAPWSHPRAAEWDSMTLSDFIARNAVLNPDGVANLIECWTQPGFGADPDAPLVPLRALVRRVLGQRALRRHLLAQLRHHERRPGAPLRRRLPAGAAAPGPAARRHRRPARTGPPDRAARRPRASCTPAAAP